MVAETRQLLAIPDKLATMVIAAASLPLAHAADARAALMLRTARGT